MGATGNPSVANHVQPVAHGIHDLGKLVERGSRPVKLTSAMIGDHYSGGADVQSTPRVSNAHNPFETELSAPLFPDILGILPIHRLVEHRAEILADRYRDVQTFCHVVFQLRQLELLVRKIVERPCRMQREAEETFERQARRRSKAGPQITLSVSPRDGVHSQRQHVEVGSEATLDHAVRQASVIGPSNHRSLILAKFPANSLLPQKNSLLGIQKFPAPLRREFGCKPMDSLAEWRRKLANEPKIVKNSLQIPGVHPKSETRKIRDSSP